MASGAHQLQQQGPQLEKGIRALVNEGLKKICRAHGYQVSGPKAVLVTRCLESKDQRSSRTPRQPRCFTSSHVHCGPMLTQSPTVLDNAIQTGDVAVIEELRYRINHPGRDPPLGALSNGTSANGTSKYSNTQGFSMPLQKMGQGYPPPSQPSHRKC